ncbi:MAG: amidohydrolase family protein [Armatimonadota bacterium]
MLIDVNTCFGAAPTRRVSYAAAVARARTVDEPGPADPTSQDVDWSLDNLLAILDGHEVDRALTWSLRGKLYDPVAGNDETWQAARRHPQLVPVATLDPRRGPAWRDELARCIDRGMRIFRFFPDAQGWSLGALPFPRIAEALAGHNATVMLPAGGAGQQTAAARMLCPLGLTVVAVGATFSAVAESMAVMAEHERFLCETSAMCTAGAVETVVGAVGAGQLLFGSNSPEFAFEAPLNLVTRAEISAADQQCVLGGNALEYLLGGERP